MKIKKWGKLLIGKLPQGKSEHNNSWQVIDCADVGRCDMGCDEYAQKNCTVLNNYLRNIQEGTM